MIGSTATRTAWKRGLDVFGDLAGNGVQPFTDEIISMQKSRAINVFYPSCSVIQIEYGLCLFNDIRIVQYESSRTVQSLFFTAPKPDQDGTFGIGQHFF